MDFRGGKAISGSDVGKAPAILKVANGRILGIPKSAEK